MPEQILAVAQPSGGASRVKAVRAPQTGSYFRRLTGKLLRDQHAMSALADMGIDRHMVQLLGLGLKEPYVRLDGRRVEKVLAYALQENNGRRRYAYLNLKGHTINPEHAVGWGPGEPETVCGTKRQGTLIVCGSAFEVWQIDRAATAADIGAAAICSSQPGRMPAPWLRADHWASWGRVIVLETVETGCQKAIKRIAQRPVETSRGALSLCGADELATIEALRNLLENACELRFAVNDMLNELTDIPVDFDTRPMSVHGGISGGLGYYLFTVERRHPVPGRDHRILHSYQSLVLRSDGQLLEATTLPAPRGTPSHRRVHALSDGTRIQSLPEPGHHASWSLAGIRKFAEARQNGEDPCYSDATELAVQGVNYLRSLVLLPNKEDYWRLIAFVLAGYVYRLFDALPIIHIHGEKGTGKSELTGAIATLGFNGGVMSQGSASALVRLVRESGGLVALDDAEHLASGGGDIGQALKQGYKAATALKVIAHPGGRTETIDFFGPRIVCNTLGLDPVLGSRSLRVRTQSLEGNESMFTPVHLNVDAWRDAVHAFTMSRLPQIQAAYDTSKAVIRDRRAEILAPLKAIASVVGLKEMATAIDSAR